MIIPSLDLVLHAHNVQCQFNQWCGRQSRECMIILKSFNQYFHIFSLLMIKSVIIKMFMKSNLFFDATVCIFFSNIYLHSIHFSPNSFF